MHDLQLVGVHDDGEHLVLSDSGGQRYLLPVDEALRAAVRRDRAHLGQAQNEANGRLRPREVQARVRAGMDAETIAEAAGWPVEKVRRFEGPVLAERAHMAQLAREVRLRRRAGEPVTLDAEVTHRLVERGVDPEQVTWDSWRGDDGPWTVSVEFTAGGRERRATWQFDLAARAVVPSDDEARWLSEQSPTGDGPLSAARLAAVPVGSGAGAVYDIEADGGVSTGRPPGAVPVDRDPVDLMSAMRTRRREREQPARSTDRRPHRPGSDPADVPGPTHPARRSRPPVADTRDELPGPPRPVVAKGATPAKPHGPKPHEAKPQTRPHEGTPRETKPVGVQPAGAVPAGPTRPAAPPAPVTVDVEERPIDVRTDAEASAEAPDPLDGPAVPRGAKPRARRASVPSWDDIMFGAKRD